MRAYDPYFLKEETELQRTDFLNTTVLLSEKGFGLHQSATELMFLIDTLFPMWP